MAQKLTKKRKNGALKGELYARPPIIEAEINAAILTSNDQIFARLGISDSKAHGYLRSECLVHLIRQALAVDNSERYNRVLPVLLRRCERILYSKVSDRIVHDAQGLREEILQDFSELFIVDLRDPSNSKLDMFECKFNLAFRTMRLDRLEKARNHSDHFKDPPQERADGSYQNNGSNSAQISTEGWTLPLQDSAIMSRELYEAILALPPDVRKALILCKINHLKEESIDPDETTSAKLCGCSGRTIRNRLKQARELLEPFKEYLKP